MKGPELVAAAETLDREARRYEGLKAAAAVLREVGTLEGRAEEAERRHKEAVEGIRFAENQAAEVMAKTQQVITEASDRLVAVQAEGAQIIKDASEQAASMIAEAKAEVQQQGQVELAAARREVAQVVRQAEDAVATRDKAKTQETAALIAVDTAKKELAELTRQINAAKEKIAGFVS